MMMISLGRTAVGLSLVALLSACGSASSNPNFFTVDIDAGKLTGRYNSAGFTTAQVRDLLKSNCRGGALSGYSEQPGEGGQVSFAATCRGGTVTEGGNVEIERAGTEVVSQTTSTDVNGNISYSTNRVAQ